MVCSAGYPLPAPRALGFSWASAWSTPFCRGWHCDASKRRTAEHPHHGTRWVGRGCGSMVRCSSSVGPQANSCCSSPVRTLITRRTVCLLPLPGRWAFWFSAYREHQPYASNVTDTVEKRMPRRLPGPAPPPGGPPLRPCHRLREGPGDRPIASPELTNVYS